jgi:hypothetical protein
MKDRMQSVIPTSGSGVDAAKYAVGRMHKGNPPAMLPAPKNMGMGRRGADQPKMGVPAFKTHKG